MDSRPKLRPSILTRTETVAAIAEAFAASLGVTGATLSTVSGYAMERNLRSLELLFYNGAGRTVGYSRLEIDWERHEMLLASGDDKRVFKLDISENIAAQLDHIIDDTTAFILRKIELASVVSRRTFYTPRFVESEEDNQSRNQRLGLTTLSERDKADLAYWRERSVSVEGKVLGEIGIAQSFDKSS